MKSGKNSFYARYIKRMLDIVLSLVGMLVFSPIYLCVAILVRVKLGTPVIFCQERPGRNEKIFKLYKFRSMEDVIDANGRLLPDNERLTKFGKILRSTSLDELPELLNILKGEMSIIGPRPLAVQYLPYYNVAEKHRHDVRPGLTGLAQVNGRVEIGWEERFAYDIQYVEHLSCFLDIRILILTIQKVFCRKNVMASGKVENFDDFRRRQQKEVSLKESGI